MTTSYYLPDVRVEVAFNAGVNTPSSAYVWTDVSDYVEADRGITITGGRQNEQSTTSSAAVTLTFDNSDGRFTPDLASSPYYPNVLIGRPLRVVAEWDGVEYPLGFGFVDDWPLTWEDGTDATAYSTVSASGRLARLGDDVKLRSIVEAAVEATGPFAYYTLGEPEGSTFGTDSSGSARAPLVQAGGGTAVTFGTGTGPGTDGLTAAVFAGGKFLRTGSETVTADVAGAVFFKTSTVSVPIFHIGGSFNLLLSLDASGRVQLGGYGTPSAQLITTTSYADGQTHHVALSFDSGTNDITVWVDGVNEGTFGPSWVGFGSDAVPPLAFTVGNEYWSQVSPLAFPTPFVGTMSHAALWTTTLDDSDVANMALAGLTAYVGDTPAARLTRYASFAGVAATELDFDTGQVPGLAHIDTTGSNVLGVMRRVEATEEGVLFDGRDGKLVFHDRAHRYGVSSSFGLSVALQEVEQGLAPTYDRALLVNESHIVGATGARGDVVDTTSRTAYGPKVDGVSTTDTNDPDEPLLKASWHVNQFAQPRVRVPNVEVFGPGHHFPAPFGVEVFGWDAFGGGYGNELLAADVGTRFTLDPPAQLAADPLDLFVEGYTITITGSSFRLLFNVAPAEPYDVWTVEDAELGAIDETPIAY